MGVPLAKCVLHIYWVQSKRHRLWFSHMKACSCYSTKTYIYSVILILKLNLTSLRNIYIKMCVVLNEGHFLYICFSTKSNSIRGWGSCCLHSLSNNDTIFVENHNLWRFHCTQWYLHKIKMEYVMFYSRCIKQLKVVRSTNLYMQTNQRTTERVTFIIIPSLTLLFLRIVRKPLKLISCTCMFV